MIPVANLGIDDQEDEQGTAEPLNDGELPSVLVGVEGFHDVEVTETDKLPVIGGLIDNARQAVLETKIMDPKYRQEQIEEVVQKSILKLSANFDRMMGLLESAYGSSFVDKVRKVIKPLEPQLAKRPELFLHVLEVIESMILASDTGKKFKAKANQAAMKLLGMVGNFSNDESKELEQKTFREKFQLLAGELKSVVGQVRITGEAITRFDLIYHDDPVFRKVAADLIMSSASAQEDFLNSALFDPNSVFAQDADVRSKIVALVGWVGGYMVEPVLGLAQVLENKEDYLKVLEMLLNFEENERYRISGICRELNTLKDSVAGYPEVQGALVDLLIQSSEWSSAIAQLGRSMSSAKKRQVFLEKVEDIKADSLSIYNLAEVFEVAGDDAELLDKLLVSHSDHIGSLKDITKEVRQNPEVLELFEGPHLPGMDILTMAIRKGFSTEKLRIIKDVIPYSSRSGSLSDADKQNLDIAWNGLPDIEFAVEILGLLYADPSFIKQKDAILAIVEDDVAVLGSLAERAREWVHEEGLLDDLKAVADSIAMPAKDFVRALLKPPLSEEELSDDLKTSLASMGMKVEDFTRSRLRRSVLDSRKLRSLLKLKTMLSDAQDLNLEDVLHIYHAMGDLGDFFANAEQDHLTLTIADLKYVTDIQSGYGPERFAYSRALEDLGGFDVARTAKIRWAISMAKLGDEEQRRERQKIMDRILRKDFGADVNTYLLKQIMDHQELVNMMVKNSMGAAATLGLDSLVEMQALFECLLQHGSKVYVYFVMYRGRLYDGGLQKMIGGLENFIAKYPRVFAETDLQIGNLLGGLQPNSMGLPPNDETQLSEVETILTEELGNFEGTGVADLLMQIPGLEDPVRKANVVRALPWLVEIKKMAFAKGQSWKFNQIFLRIAGQSENFTKAEGADAFKLMVEVINALDVDMGFFEDNMGLYYGLGGVMTFLNKVLEFPEIAIVLHQFSSAVEFERTMGVLAKYGEKKELVLAFYKQLAEAEPYMASMYMKPEFSRILGHLVYLSGLYSDQNLLKILPVLTGNPEVGLNLKTKFLRSLGGMKSMVQVIKLIALFDTEPELLLHLPQEVVVDFIDFPPEKLRVYAGLLERLTSSASLELRKFAMPLFRELIQASDPEGKLDKLESVFVKNNLPYVAKVFLVFQIMHTAEQLADKCTANGSPVLFSMKSPRRRISTVYADLIGIHLHSGNPSLKEYLETIKSGQGILDRVDEQGIEGLNVPEQKGFLSLFNKLATLQAYSLLGRVEAAAMPQISMENAVFQYQELRASLRVAEGQKIMDRVAEMFLYPVGLKTVDQALQLMEETNHKADSRGRELYRLHKTEGVKFVVGDFVKGVDERFVSDILGNGSVCKEFLGYAADSDNTPLDTDLERIMNEEQETARNLGLATNYGQMMLVLKDPSRKDNYQYTQAGEAAKPAPGKWEVFQTKYLGDSHYGIRTGFPDTEIDYVVARDGLSLDRKRALFLEIVKNGFYLPVVDEDGRFIYSPEDYERDMKMYFGGTKFDPDRRFNLISNVLDEQGSHVAEMSEMIEEKTRNIDEMRRLSAEVEKTIRETLIEEGVYVHDSFSSVGEGAYIISSGSSDRFTNMVDAFDLDYILKLDEKDKGKAAVISAKLMSKWQATPHKFHNPDAQFRVTEAMVLGKPVEIDIAYVGKGAQEEYESHEAVADRLEAIRGHDGEEQYLRVLANIVLAKKFLKSKGIYKKVEEGGFGGIGVETWILQHGGSLSEALERFVENAFEGDKFLSIEEVRKKYAILDPGVNAKSRGHDDFLAKLGSANSGMPHDVAFTKFAMAVKDGLDRIKAGKRLVED